MQALRHEVHVYVEALLEMTPRLLKLFGDSVFENGVLT